MKMSGLTLLAAIAAGTLATAPVLADRQVEVHRTVTTTTTHNSSGWHHANHGRRKVCRTQWYHHRKVRRCHWQRW